MPRNVLYGNWSKLYANYCHCQKLLKKLSLPNSSRLSWNYCHCSNCQKWFSFTGHIPNNWLIAWCFLQLTSVMSGQQLAYSCFSIVSPVLGWGSDTPMKSPEDPVWLEPSTPGLGVKYFYHWATQDPSRKKTCWNHCGKRSNRWWPAFPPFPHIFYPMKGK